MRQVIVETLSLIGHYTVEFEQRGEPRAAYGYGVMKQLFHRLTIQFGKFFGISNLKYIRKLYLTVPKRWDIVPLFELGLLL